MSTHYNPIQLTFDEMNNSRWLLQDAWGKMLSRHTWEWFVTMTFTEDVHPEAAVKKWRLWASKLARSLYGARWSKKPHLYWVVSIEFQKRGVLHLHGLIVGVRDARRLTWMDEWEGLDYKTGYARIYPVEDNLKASRYVSKYVSKGGEILFSDNFPNITFDLFNESCPD
jgi:hypothetical protein